MRWIMITPSLTGIGMTLLLLSIFQQPNALYMYLIAAGIFVVVLVGAIISTFTTLSGYVHPDDKMFINVFTFYYALALIMMTGYHFMEFQYYTYRFGTTMFTSFIIIYLLVSIGKPSVRMVIEGEIREKKKETTARVIALTLVFGALAGGIQLGFDWLYMSIGYNYASWCLGAVAFISFTIISIIFKGIYEPVSE